MTQMNAAQLGALALVVGQAITVFLLTQNDVVIPPVAKLLIGALSVGLTTAALYLKVNLPGRPDQS